MKEEKEEKEELVMRRHHKSALVLVFTGALVGVFSLGGMSMQAAALTRPSCARS
jgi:hypothetical protein